MAKRMLGNQKTFSLMIAILLAVPSIFASEIDISSLPNGYRDGRTDVPYGTYNTVVSQSARQIQNQLLVLENKSHGLALTAHQDPVRQAEVVYTLEVETLALLLDIMNSDKLTAYERSVLSYGAQRVYERIRTEAERQYHDMIRFVDHALPGPNGLQVKVERHARSRHAIFYPNYRTHLTLSIEEQKQFYQDKLNEFLNSGGRLSEMKILNKLAVSDFSSLARFEYVVLENKEVRFSAGNMGHLLLSEGKPVLAAGQMVLLKVNGHIQLAIISNASGTYKPDLVSVKLLEPIFRSQLGTKNFIYTQGEPLGTQTVKIYMKAMQKPKEDIQQKVKNLNQLFDQKLSTRSGHSCQRLFL